MVGLLGTAVSGAAVAGATPATPAPSEVTGAVVGGEPAPPGSWPSIAALVDGTLFEEGAFCGGTLVAPDWVLTAAHCAVAIDEYSAWENVTVVLGRHDLADTAVGEERGVVQAVVHPAYFPEPMLNDVALLRLDEPTDRPAMPLLDHDQEPAWSGFDTPGQVAGWGLTSTGEEPTVPLDLQQATIPVWGDDTCLAVEGFVPGQHLCAAASFVDSCNGDSGGPLAAYSRSGVWSVAGIVSFGTVDCGASPGVYTRVSTHLPWLRSILGPPPAGQRAVWVNETTVPAGGVVARGAALERDGSRGVVVDADANLYPFGVDGHAAGHDGPVPAPVSLAPGSARGVGLLPGGGGYVLDGSGGLHPFGTHGQPAPPAVTNGPSWPGWDIARGVVLRADGLGGYVLDGFGGLHPFSIGDAPLPPAATDGPWWPGWDAARGVAIEPDGSGGWIVDGSGGIHPVGFGGHPAPPALGGLPTWPGQDQARGLVVLPSLRALVVDAGGVLHAAS